MQMIYAVRPSVKPMIRGMVASDDREDLGALLARAARRVVDGERPLLHARGLSMWGYIALSHLAGGPAHTQLALAQAMGYDKTRLIALLDELEGERLVTRRPDPADRRARVVGLTPEGRARHAAARADVRAMEAELLDHVPTADRRTFLAVLSRIVPRDG